jgi:hypothetical protein
VLLGLSARGARVEAGDTQVEVDPDGQPHRCYGIGAGPRRLAASVLSEFAIRVQRPRELGLPVDVRSGLAWRLKGRLPPVQPTTGCHAL